MIMMIGGAFTIIFINKTLQNSGLRKGRLHEIKAEKK